MSDLAEAASGLLATTGSTGGIGGAPLPIEAVIGGIVIVAIPYGLAVLVAARRGKLGTGRDELRTEPGPSSSAVSLQAALAWQSAGPGRRSVVVNGAGGRHAELDPSGSQVLLTGFDGVAALEPRDVLPELAAERSRRQLAADLDRAISRGGRLVVFTFERVAT